MEIVDEIEFFGLVPVAFIAELQEEAEKILRESIERLSQLGRSRVQRMSSVLLESFKKNYFIFSNFVLRNIFRFPSTFRLERRASDLVVTADLQAITNDLVGSFEEEDYYKAEIQRLREELEVEMYRRDSYGSLLSCSDAVNSLVLGIRQVHEDFEAVRELYSKLTMINNADDDDLNALLEYREIKNNLAKKERDDLLAIGSDEAFSTLGALR